MSKEAKVITKVDFVSEIASELEVSKAMAAKFVDVFFDKVSCHLSQGNKVAFTGYATFSTAERKAREGRNPQTGKTIKIPAKKVVKIKAGKKLQGVCGK